MRYLAQIFAEADGSPSSIRVLMFAVTLMVLGPGCYASVKKAENFVPTPEQIGIVVALAGTKVFQRGKEGAEQQAAPQPPQQKP